MNFTNALTLVASLQTLSNPIDGVEDALESLCSAETEQAISDLRKAVRQGNKVAYQQFFDEL